MPINSRSSVSMSPLKAGCFICVCSCRGSSGRKSRNMVAERVHWRDAEWRTSRCDGRWSKPHSRLIAKRTCGGLRCPKCGTARSVLLCNGAGLGTCLFGGPLFPFSKGLVADPKGLGFGTVRLNVVVVCHGKPSCASRARGECSSRCPCARAYPDQHERIRWVLSQAQSH